jgi:hypothetical protein
MDSAKCPACGLVNFADVDACRRCGHGLEAYTPARAALVRPRVDGGRGFWQWLLWIGGATITILLVAYASLLLTSDSLTDLQHATVVEAIDTLERAGFDTEAGRLRRYASFRSSDNWWNRHVGHANAYAATNFPFGVITLYPAFYQFPVDDTERAAILLHEASHLTGGEEDEALLRVWREKGRLGWTAARYGRTRVFRNTREWTAALLPRLFSCGDGTDDCAE